MEYNITPTCIQGTQKKVIEAHHDVDTKQSKGSKVFKIQF